MIKLESNTDTNGIYNLHRAILKLIDETVPYEDFILPTLALLVTKICAAEMNSKEFKGFLQMMESSYKDLKRESLHLAKEKNAQS